MEHYPTAHEIDRYLAGELSPEARIRIDDWLDQQGDRRPAVTLLRQELAGVTTRPVRLDTEWRQIQQRISSISSAARPGRQERSRTRPGAVWNTTRGWMAAAAIVALVSFMVTKPNIRTMVTTIVARTTAAETSLREYATANGERATIQLQDGTVVVLNVGSKLRVAAAFGHGGRDVYLDGEAKFTVTHDESSPFIVHAGGARIRDLATVFNVRAYPGATITSVAVAEGKVDVRSVDAPTPNGAVLGAGEMARVKSNGTTDIVLNAPVAEVMAWTTGRLVIDNMPMREALTQLARWWDVQFEVRDTGKLQGNLTATATDTPLVQQDLHDLGYLLGATIAREGKTIVISPSSSR